MNEEARRWANLEGPPPPLVARLLEAARYVEPLTPEEAEQMDRAFFAALAERRAQHARSRRNKRWFLGAGLTSAAAAAAIVAGIALHRGAPTGNAGAPILKDFPSPAAGRDAGAPPGIPNPRGRGGTGR